MKDKKKILVVGDIMLDIYHFGKVNRISPEAPVPVFLETGEYKSVPGGAANVAVNIAAIGIETSLFSMVGDDKEGDVLLKILEASKINTSNIKKSADRKTISKLRFIGPNNQQMFRVDTEDTEDIAYANVEDFMNLIMADINTYGLILLSDYKKGFLTEEVSQKLINIGKKAGIPVLIDVKDKNLNKYKGAYLLKPNRKELQDLTGMETKTFDDVEKAAIKLCESTDCKYVLITLGADGMFLANKEGKLAYSRSVAKEVFDVTGAGDTSIAYLAAEILLGKSIYEAVEIANYAAGVQVSKVGTSIVDPYEVEFAMKQGTFSLNMKQINFYQEGSLKRIEDEKSRGRKIVFTNGCFDILHVGHATYLKKAKELGDILVVGINSDASVKRLKGKDRPVNSLNDRALLLSALEFVDYVIPFEEDTPYNLIKQIIPDILVKGGDYNIEDIVGREIIQENGGIVTTIPLVVGKSTTKTINKMQGRNNI